MDKKGAAGGMQFDKREGEIKPPFEGREAEDEFQEPLPERQGFAGAEQVAKEGKVPLHPAVIRLPFSVFGRIGTELTGYAGFTFTEQELNDLAELWMATGVMMTPMLQAAIGTTAMIAGKSAGYLAWTKAGKPKVAGAEAIGKETAEPEEAAE